MLLWLSLLVLSPLSVIGATLFVRTLAVATEADLGYDHTDVAAASHRIPDSGSDQAAVTQALTG